MTKAKKNDLDKAAIITALMDKFDEIYIYPDVAAKMKSHLMGKLKQNKYDEYTTITDFAGQLTDDLREISDDRHIIIYKALPRDLAKSAILIETRAVDIIGGDENHAAVDDAPVHVSNVGADNKRLGAGPERMGRSVAPAGSQGLDASPDSSHQTSLGRNAMACRPRSQNPDLRRQGRSRVAAK